MADRTVQVGGVWANGAPAPPAEPIAENTYANNALSQADIEAGWPFKKIVDSADFNELMRRVTAIIQLVEQWGVVPWSALTTYEAGARVIGSNGLLYRALLASSGADPKNPTTYPTHWVSDDGHAASASPHSGHATTAALSAHTSASAPHAGHETPSGAQTKVNTHAAIITGAHGATSEAWGNYPVNRDANGRAKFVGGVASGQAVTFDQFGLFAATNGYQRLPQGLIIQWGTSNSASVTFPITFPSYCAGVFLTHYPAVGDLVTTSVSARSVSNFTINGWSYQVNWFAIGW